MPKATFKTLARSEWEKVNIPKISKFLDKLVGVYDLHGAVTPIDVFQWYTGLDVPGADFSVVQSSKNVWGVLKAVFGKGIASRSPFNVLTALSTLLGLELPPAP